MSTAAPDERAIETEVTTLAERVDKGVDRSGSIGCLAIIVGVAVLWPFLGAWSLVAGLPLTLVSFFAAVQYDEWIARSAARRFNERFAADAPDREIALHVLGELTGRGSGLEKFRSEVRGGPGVRRVRVGPAVEQQLAQAISAPKVETSPPAPVSRGPQPLELDAAPTPAAAPRPAKVIPLEPFEHDDAPNREVP